MCKSAFCLLLSYVCHCPQYKSVESVAMKKQQCSLCINWATCHCQQYETVEFCHGNTTVGSLYIFVKLQNIAYCCQQYKHTYAFMWSAWCLILTKLGIPWQIFIKFTNIKFHKICLVGAELIQTDRHDEASRPFSQLMKRCLRMKFWSSMKRDVENSRK